MAQKRAEKGGFSNEKGGERGGEKLPRKRKGKKKMLCKKTGECYNIKDKT